MENNQNKKNWTGWFWSIVITLFVICCLVDFLLLAKYSIPISAAGMKTEWNWGWAAFFTQVLYVVFSFKTVGPTELGAILFFGRPIKEVRSGLVFVPLGICQLKTETRLTIQEELPGDPALIFRGTGEVPKGMFPPIRIPFANKPKDPEKTDPGDPLNRRVTAEVVPIIRYRIADYILFLTTIGDREQAKKQMEDATIALCMRELPQMTVAEALVTLLEFNQTLQKTIEQLVHEEEIDGKLVQKWGIKVETVQIKLINFHHDLNQAIASVPEAEFTAKKRRLDGEGEGAFEKAILDGRTAGLLVMKKELGLDGGIILSAETARAITNNPGQKTVITGVKGFADLIGIATAIEKTIKKESEA